MQIHSIPRNVKGEGRILMIFTTKSLIFSAIGGAFGLIFYYIFAKIMGLTYLGIGLTIFFAAIGYGIATLKIPESNALEITRKGGGQNIDEIIVRFIKFYAKKNRIYTYIKTKEENK